ncbi:MAG: hypothetical protein EOP83_09790 [Verrucomicrobiaceae bacterium]|nr:MAG: hypothetical protein EOP83_09790 [Verrucomicrobiaceae bacterium]
MIEEFGVYVPFQEWAGCFIVYRERVAEVEEWCAERWPEGMYRMVGGPTWVYFYVWTDDQRFEFKMRWI